MNHSVLPFYDSFEVTVAIYRHLPPLYCWYRHWKQVNRTLNPFKITDIKGSPKLTSSNNNRKLEVFSLSFEEVFFEFFTPQNKRIIFPM